MQNKKTTMVLFLSVLFFSFLLVNVCVFAATPNPGHSASYIGSGNFGSMPVQDNGDYNFTGNGRVGIGTSSPVYKLDVVGDIRARNAWLRTTGQTGWYNDTYGGGWHMTDSTWVRAYNSKPIYSPAEIRSGSLLRAPSFTDLDNGNYYINPSGSPSAILNGNVGIGTTTPRATLDVIGSIRGANARGSLAGVNLATIEAGPWGAGWDAIRGYTDSNNSSAVIGVATGSGPYAPNYGLYSWGGVVINRYYGSAGNGNISEANLYFSGYNHGIFWGDTGPAFNRDNNLPHIESSGDGNLWVSAGADGGTVYLQTGHQNADVAEYYKKKSGEKIEGGDVVSIDENEDETITVSKSEYDSRLVGIVSTSPGMTIGSPSKELIPLALVGRVLCKVTNINGKIKRGDLLTSSSIPGYAMKATKSGPVIGKALQEFNGKKGKILVFANTSWYYPEGLGKAENSGGVREKSFLEKIFGR